MILEESLKNLQVGVRGGGNLVTHRPLFSNDSKSLFVISSNTVKAYSTETGFSIGQIRTPSAAPIANITHLPNPSSGSEEEVLIILTITGELLHASLHNFQLLKVENINESFPDGWARITNWINVICPRPDVYLLVGHPENIEETMLYQVTRPSGGKGRKAPSLHFEKICWKILSNTHSVACGLSGELVAAVQDDSVFMTNTTTRATRWHKSGTRKFTCVAAHPHEWIVATGDDSGRIVVWRNFIEDKSPAKSVFHWHTLPVADLIFSTDGTRMLSGGGECTLVKWDIEDSVNKRTLPRLGLPIRHISGSYANVLSAVSHADNCIQIIDSTNAVVTSIQNITQCYIPEGSEDVSPTSFGGSAVFQAGLCLDPNNKSLVMNGKPGHLQCYSLRDDKHLYMMDITQQNYITAERRKAIQNAGVCNVAFSKQGRWLATVESLLDQGKSIELRLKFWKFDETKRIFSLNTSINWPHEIGITSLRFQPVDDNDLGLVAATSGADQTFRTWGVVYDQSIHGKSDWWNCEHVGRYKNLEAGPVAFSQDGSVLAASFGSTLTLWTTEIYKLNGTLCHTKLQEDIRLLEFATHPTPHLVLCCSKQHLVVWDVLTLSLLWAVPFQAENIAVDGLTNLVAAFSTKKHLYFFRPDRPEPLAIHNNVSRSTVISSIFIPNPMRYEMSGLKSTLVFINTSQELCGLLPKGEDVKSEPLRIKMTKDVSTLTPFAQLIAEKTVSHVDSSKDNLRLADGHIGFAGCQVIRDIMDSSPLTMPSVTFFCDQLLSALSKPRTASGKLHEVENQVMRSFSSRANNGFRDNDDDDDYTDTDEEKPMSRNRRSKSKAKSNPVNKPVLVQLTEESKSKKLNLDLDWIATDDAWIHTVLSQSPH